MTQVKTADYQITDYGIENADYFQGHGTAFTRFEHCTLGCGDTYAEALEDALDLAAMDGFDIDLADEDMPEKLAGQGPSAFEQHKEYCEQETAQGEEEADHSECESNLYYYVGLRWNVIAKAEGKEPA